MENTTFTFTPASGNAISYSIDNGDSWTVGNSVEITKGNKVLWKGEMTPASNSGVGAFSSTGRFEAQGNIMSLLFGDNFKGRTDLTGKNYAFSKLFSSNSNLINAQNLSLPATTLASLCYSNMFEGCTSLTTAPELPATILADSCYEYMFYRCTSLVTAPVLPATTLAIYCYNTMFRGCTSLVTAPTLPATTLANYCYINMFNSCTNLNYIKCLATDISASLCLYNWVSGVSATGTFVKNADATWDVTGESGIPSGWDVQNSN